mmetsp:Transcript_100141/g.172925  ORF Transcript_100141/g.172925 Transcript_100141/m.172925 type:complete len:88 (+) Transcript_100141:144-407(+)
MPYIFTYLGIWCVAPLGKGPHPPFLPTKEEDVMAFCYTENDQAFFFVSLAKAKKKKQTSGQRGHMVEKGEGESSGLHISKVGGDNFF